MQKDLTDWPVMAKCSWMKLACQKRNCFKAAQGYELLAEQDDGVYINQLHNDLQVKIFIMAERCD